MDGFIFVGTNFCGLNENDTFLVVQNLWPQYFPSKFIQKITYSWILEFVDWALHENHKNWYPTKIKPSTVSQFSRHLQVTFIKVNEVSHMTSTLDCHDAFWRWGFHVDFQGVPDAVSIVLPALFVLLIRNLVSVTVNLPEVEDFMAMKKQETAKEGMADCKTNSSIT